MGVYRVLGTPKIQEFYQSKLSGIFGVIIHIYNIMEQHRIATGTVYFGFNGYIKPRRPQNNRW